MCPIQTRITNSTVVRSIASNSRLANEAPAGKITKTELDSHADNTVFGDGCFVENDTGQRATVDPFLSTLGSAQDIQVITAAVAYDDPQTWTTFIQHFHNSLYIPEMDRNLICPAQCEANDVTINLKPLSYIPYDERKVTDHSIITQRPHEEMHIPLKLEGTTSYYETRKPTHYEVFHDPNVVHVHMTPEGPWDPNDPSFAEIEDSLRADLEAKQLPYERGRNIGSLRTSAAIDVDQELLYRYAAMSTEIDDGIQQLRRFVDEDQPPTPATANTARISALFGRTAREYTKLRHINATITKNRKGAVTAEALAKRWRIGLETAKNTIDRTTQRAVRNFENTTGSRRLKPYANQLKYRRIDSELYTDTLIGRCKSLLGNKYVQMYATPFHYCLAEPMEAKSDAHKTLDNVWRKVGYPSAMIPDNAKEMTEGQFKHKCQSAQVPIRPVEAYTKNMAQAETVIREVKKGHRRQMIATRTPECLWDLSVVYAAHVHTFTYHNIPMLKGEVPHTVMTGDTADISHLCEFGWYQWVWYIDPEDVNMERKQLGHYCGPSFDVGDAMCSYILKANGQLIHRSSVIPLTLAEENSPAVDQRKREYEETLKLKLKDRFEPLSEAGAADETLEAITYEPIFDDDDMGIILDEADAMDHEAFDKYISAKVQLSRGDQVELGTVKRRKRDQDGKLIGTYNDNPFASTALYEVEFANGDTEAFYANQIAENIYATVDDHGYTVDLIDEIIDHKSDNTALKGDDGYITQQNGIRKQKRTTQGWQLCVRFKTGDTQWVKLKELKETNPIETAEYAKANKIDHEPAFAWWVDYTLKKRAKILSAVKKRLVRKNQKYGIEIPTSVKHALQLDEQNKDHFWRDAIRKEMKVVEPAFELLPEGSPIPPGYKEIRCHLVFDVKSDFQRKARFVAGGHMTEPTASISYASVVSRESVRIAFMLAALNGVDLKCADAQGAYLNAKCKEKITTICGPEFGDELCGRRAKIILALYGLRSSGSAWRSELAAFMMEALHFKACRADADVWYRPAEKRDGVPYYEYVLIHTDDFCVVSEDPDTILHHVDQRYLIKKGSIGHPTQYLGAGIGKFTPPDAKGEEYWSMGSEQYVKEAVRNVSNWLEQRGLKLKSRAQGVLPCDYRPELDTTAPLSAEDHNYFQQQIGVLRWIVELGRIDICCEISMLAAYCAAPRAGHLEAVMHIYAYLNTHTRSRLCFDPRYVPHKGLPKHDWTDFYHDAKEQLPPDMPEPRGREVQITTFCDSDHAGDTTTRRSRTGVLIFVNMAPVIWYSKKQTSVETSSFGSEFAALKTAVELTEGLRYKLRMMGVPLDGPAHIMADNQSVIKNSSTPESMLKKKSNSIAYHYVRERVAAGVCGITYEPTASNLADMLTKIQSGSTRSHLASQVLY